MTIFKIKDRRAYVSRNCICRPSYARETHAYYLVKFVKTSELDVIPCTWRYSEEECYFPINLKNEEDRLQKVKACLPAVPKRSFRKHEVIYIYGTGTTYPNLSMIPDLLA